MECVNTSVIIILLVYKTKKGNMKKYNFCFIFILTIFIFCSCNTQSELSEEDEYVKMIEDMDETISSL